MFFRVKHQNFTYWWYLLLFISLSTGRFTSKHGTDASSSLQLHSGSVSCSFSMFPWVRYGLYADAFLWHCIYHIIKHLWDFDFVASLVKWLQNNLRKKRNESDLEISPDPLQTIDHMETFVSTYLVKQGLKVEDVFGVHKHYRGVDGILQSLAEPQEVHESLDRRDSVRAGLLNHSVLSLLKCSLVSPEPLRWWSYCHLRLQWPQCASEMGSKGSLETWRKGAARLHTDTHTTNTYTYYISAKCQNVLLFEGIFCVQLYRAALKWTI